MFKKKATSLMGLLLMLCIAFSACGTPTPITIVETIIVTEEVITAGTPIIKEVTKEVEVVVTATPDAGEETTSNAAYPRSETLYTSGTQWDPPSNWNPMVTWGYATGTIGLCYETLFLYNPMTNEYIPWLAEHGEWISDNEYELKLREGIAWSDGMPFTSADVVFTLELGQRFPSVQYSAIWDWLESAEATDDTTVRFTFSDPLYQEWSNFLYSRAMVPEHLWANRSEEDIVSGANEAPVGTGPYVYETHDQDRMVWIRNETWWAKDLLGLEVKPKRIVDIVSGSNNVALGLVLQGELDLSNNFLPGVASLIRGGYDVQTYYPEPPYMLSANTAWLIMNNTIAPMDDPAFRRAVAYAIDVNEIVEPVYGNIVKAANPTGLLPIWDQYVDKNVIDEFGFSYNPDMVQQILTDAGYVDTDGDGFVESLDGSPIKLSIIVPAGWTDWIESIKVIANSCQAVGINLQPQYPDYSEYVEARNAGSYEMLISNESQMSNTPWAYYDWIFQNPIQDIMTNGNYSRYDNQEVFDLVTQLDKTPVDDTDAMQDIITQIQAIQLDDMPLIPLWYNGLWSQVSNEVWTNWPADAEENNHYLPTTWRGYMNLTGVLMLTELEPAPVVD